MRVWMGKFVTAAVGGAAATALLLASGAVPPRTVSSSLGEPPLSPPGRFVTADPAQPGLSAAEIYRRAAPAVVGVSARRVMMARSHFARGGGSSTGSGFVIDADRGRVVCNAHTVAAAADITVTFRDGRAVPARIVGRDDDTDLALLAVDPDGLDLAALDLADFARVAIGDPTLALGGSSAGPATVTTGVVSAVRRRLADAHGFALDGVVQTDAPFGEEDTGGPLLDSQGRVIGMTGRLDVGTTTVGFAVPADTMAALLPQLEASGRVRRAFLGIREDDGAAVDGIRIAGVRHGSPAERAGLHVGDIVRAVGGVPVLSIDALARLLAGRRPGEHVDVALARGARRFTHDVTLADRPPGIADR
jgi:S1-C subfamily serine protease